MDVTFINPFLEAAVNVLQTMAFTETQSASHASRVRHHCPRVM
jgi:CheY-specific phosphatase CheX